MRASEAITLFGTDEPVAPVAILRAGALTAELDAGNLRHIRIGGVEAIRAVSFIVRDRNWGTYAPQIRDLAVDQREDGFTVRYEGETKDDRQALRYRATIEGREDHVSFAVEGEAATDFDTNRAGFVVLHPVEGVAGAPVEIEHVDGRVVHGRFPDLIDPVQPMMDLRALMHEPAPGLQVSCRMEGDTFEMEDQRNWCDASYKTYVRPLSRPWPYRIAAGERLTQTVSLSITGTGPAAETAEATIRLAVGGRAGVAPALGLGFDPAEAAATRGVLPQLQALRPRHLVCHFDPRRDHAREALDTAVAIATALGAEPWLEAIVVDVEDYAAEIERLAELVRSLGSPFRTVILSPAADLKSTTPGQPWPPAPPPAGFYRAARKSFPGVRLGGGMISTFTELNRKRPPRDHLDLVSFTTMALVHACDDISVMEGLEALPSIARSARAIAGPLPVVVGPSAIGLRMNPYGAGPVPNPGNRRVAMALNDPRQRGRLGAAWAVGYYAHLARAGIEAVAFGATTGPFGVVHTAQAWPTPGYETDGATYPIFHALRELAMLSGRPLRALDISAPGIVQGVAADAGDGIDLVLANLTGEVRDVRLAEPARSIRTAGPAVALPEVPSPDASSAATSFTLGPYEVACLHL